MKVVEDFRGFSACHPFSSASHIRPPRCSPASGTVQSLVTRDCDTAHSSHRSIHPFHAPSSILDVLDLPGGDSSENPDLDNLLPDPSHSRAQHIPQDPLAQLASAIQSLARSSHYSFSDSTSRTKVQEPDQFDGTDSHKLWVFLVQCKLNFQNCPKAFCLDHAKVTFAQSYLKGIALEWFEPDLLQSNPTSVFHPLWMDNYAEFVLELQMNFGPHDPVRDAEHELRNLSMKVDNESTSMWLSLTTWPPKSMVMEKVHSVAASTMVCQTTSKMRCHVLASLPHSLECVV